MATDRSCHRLLISEQWDLRGACVLRLSTALRVLGEPLHVLVENGLRDAAFLRRVIPPEWRRELLKWEESGKLRFENGGGIDELRQIISFMATDEGALATWGIPAAAWKLLHFLVSDHDGVNATTPSSSAQRLQSECEKAGLAKRLHVLRRTLRLQ
jgi:hypothetical protein